MHLHCCFQFNKLLLVPTPLLLHLSMSIMPACLPACLPACPPACPPACLQEERQEPDADFKPNLINTICFLVNFIIQVGG